MSKWFLVIFLLYLQAGAAQTVSELDGKWAFTGLRTTVFKVLDGKLYVAMLEYADTSNFNRFMQGLPLDYAIFREAAVSLEHDTLAIHVMFPTIDHNLDLLYAPKDSANIWYTGDVFFDSTKTISTNSNCSVNAPKCINRLYNAIDLNTLMRLKTSEEFTRDDAFEFLLRLNEKLKSRCNRCYAGFTDAYMNETLVEMGFNPIVRRVANKSVWYNTSGFTFFIKTKFLNDQTIIKLTDYIFRWYLQ